VRVLIESDPDFISAITGELEVQPGAEATPADPGSDLTEQKFGFAEAAAVVATSKASPRSRRSSNGSWAN
jgi:hypothetical protein